MVGSESEILILGRGSMSRRRDFDAMHHRSALMIWSERNAVRKLVIGVSQLNTLRLYDHFSALTYDEQNLYLTGLMIRRETKKSVGHKRKSIPSVSKYGKKVGRPPAEESSFSVNYQIRDEKGLNRKVCQKAFLLIYGFGKRRLEILRKKMPVGSTVPEPDCRGKHSNRPLKVSDELHQKVREHIVFSCQTQPLL